MAGAREDRSMWKTITRSNNEAFGVAAKGSDFEWGPTVRVGGLLLSMVLPFLSKKVLPFDLEAGRKVPCTKPTVHLGDGVVQEITFLRPNSVLQIGFREE